MSDSSAHEKKPVTRVALLGSDYRGVAFEMLCADGDEIEAGAALMRDARRPQIRFTAPVGGKIAGIDRGTRRKLVAVRIQIDPSAPALRHTAPRQQDPQRLRDFMLETGAWTSLRTRPFGNIPDPDAQPRAIFVTAQDNEPGAPPGHGVPCPDTWMNRAVTLPLG